MIRKMSRPMCCVLGLGWGRLGAGCEQDSVLPGQICALIPPVAPPPGRFLLTSALGDVASRVMLGLGTAYEGHRRGTGRAEGRRRYPRLQPVVLTARRVSFLQIHQLFLTQPEVLAVIRIPSVDQPNWPKARSPGFTKSGQGPKAQLAPGPQASRRGQS